MAEQLERLITSMATLRLLNSVALKGLQETVNPSVTTSIGLWTTVLHCFFGVWQESISPGLRLCECVQTFGVTDQSAME